MTRQRPADERVGEVVHRVLREEGDIGPVRAEPPAQVLGVGAGAGVPGTEAERRQRRVAEARLVVGRRRVGGDVEAHDVDVPAPRDGLAWDGGHRARTGRSASRPRRSLARRRRTAARRSAPRRSRARQRPARQALARRERGRAGLGRAGRAARARAPLTSSAAVRKAQPGVAPSSVSHGAPSSGRLALRAAYSSLSRRASPRIPRAPVASTPAPSASTSAAPRGRTSPGSSAASALVVLVAVGHGDHEHGVAVLVQHMGRRRRLDGRHGGAGRGTVAEHHQTFADPDITRHRRLPRRSGPRTAPYGRRDRMSTEFGTLTAAPSGSTMQPCHHRHRRSS